MSKADKDFLGEKYKAPRGSWTVYPELCKGCGLCIEKCPTHVISWSDKPANYGTLRVTVDASGCIVCRQCMFHCPDAAIHVQVDRKQQ
jgi:2-oxoglutarate ferredoxin oxidoreductase subunit delta